MAQLKAVTMDSSRPHGESMRRNEKRNWVAAAVGGAAVLMVMLLVALAALSFRGDFTETARVTVMSPRAGLVLDDGAKVKMLGVEVGRVESINASPDGGAILQLAVEKSKLDLIPSNVEVDIASTTVFGAKFVQLVPPANATTDSLRAGQVLDAQHVTVEINTIFERLNSLMTTIDPAKMNATLEPFARAVSGRGAQIGQTFVDFDNLLKAMDPALPALRHDLATAPQVLNTYADASDDLVTIIKNGTKLSQTLVDTRHDLDAMLLSSIGLADVGTPFLADNRAALGSALHLLLPTTSLLDEYAPALNCSMNGFVDIARFAESTPDSPQGIVVSVNFLLGHDRYRYPQDLPKVAASGGPRCEVLPVKYQQHPKFVVADTGVNPFERGNTGILLNSEGLKEVLFGPQDGPPRNSAQIGQPG